MNALYTIKLKNGKDVIGKLVTMTDTDVTIADPIEVNFYINSGVEAKSFLLLSSKDEVRINKDDTIFIHRAGDSGVSIYEQYRSAIESRTQLDESDSFFTDLNNMTTKIQ